MPRPALLLFLALTPTIHAQAQSPEARYKAAKTTFAAHSDGFLTDGSPAASAALQQMWIAIAEHIIERRTLDPRASASTLDHELCLLTAEPNPPEAIQQTPEEQCAPGPRDRAEVLALNADLLLVAPFTGEVGTVFLIGPRDGKLAILWSIADAAPQPNDPHDLIGAWKPERAANSCRDKGSQHKPGACGPLYASLGLLPPDSAKHPRFYIDAGYAQSMGATIGKQTTVWVWNGKRAELLWSDWYDFMIDQSRDTDFANGILSIVSKESFRSFFACGSCEERQTEHDVLIEPTRIRDLGTHSLVPELDIIDNLFWKLAHGQSAAGLAAPKVIAFLRPQLVQSRKDSARATPGFFTTGMMDDSLVMHTSGGATVCLYPDDLGILDFTLRRTGDGGYFITRVLPSKASECAQPSYLPFTPAEESLPDS